MSPSTHSIVDDFLHEPFEVWNANVGEAIVL